MRQLPNLFLFLFFMLAPKAYAQEPASNPVNKPLPFKGALGPISLPEQSSTQEKIDLIEEVTEKGRLLHETSRNFEERYRSFVSSLRDWQRKGAKTEVCNTANAAKAYLEAEVLLQDFEKKRREFTSLLEPIKLSKDNKFSLTPTRLQQIDKILSYEKESKALETFFKKLFSEQMKGEITSLGCSEEVLVKVAKEKPKFGSIYGMPQEPKRPKWIPSGLLPPVTPSRVPFTINNVDCETTFSVVLDGEFLGKASAQSVTSFNTTEGWHFLCLIREGKPMTCNRSSSGVRTYMYEGWWVKTQCPSL